MSYSEETLIGPVLLFEPLPMPTKTKQCFQVNKKLQAHVKKGK